MALGPYEISDKKWNRLLAHVNNVATERGVESFEERLQLVKEFYRLPNDVEAMDAALDDVELTRLKRHDVEQDEVARTRKARIVELENKRKRT